MKDKEDYKKLYEDLYEIYTDQCIRITELSTTIKTLMRIYVRQEDVNAKLRSC